MTYTSIICNYLLVTIHMCTDAAQQDLTILERMLLEPGYEMIDDDSLTHICIHQPTTGSASINDLLISLK